MAAVSSSIHELYPHVSRQQDLKLAIARDVRHAAICKCGAMALIILGTLGCLAINNKYVATDYNYKPVFLAMEALGALLYLKAGRIESRVQKVQLFSRR